MVVLYQIISYKYHAISCHNIMSQHSKFAMHHIITYLTYPGIYHMEPKKAISTYSLKIFYTQTLHKNQLSVTKAAKWLYNTFKYKDKCVT